MAEASVGPAVAPASGPPMPERTHYAAGGGRRTMLSFVFLLLLPFFVSLPVMLYQRFTHGLLGNAAGLMILGVAFALVMLLVLFHLLFSIRSRIVLGEKAVRFTLPRRAGYMPMLRYATHDIPYDQIAAVETRREIYGGSVAPVLMRGARLVTNDGKQIPLGYVSEANVDPCFPFEDIARQIAARAGLGVTDRGTVRRAVRKKLLGVAASEAENQPVPEAEIEALNRRHNLVMMILVGAMGVLLVAGLFDDFATGSIDRGERARDAVQESAKPTPKAQKR